MAVVRFRQFWGERKREELLQTLEGDEAGYEVLVPVEANRFGLRSGTAQVDYGSWAAPRDLSAVAPHNGPIERRGMALIDFDRNILARRVEAYFDGRRTNEEIAALYPSLMMTGNRIIGPEARRKLLAEHQFRDRSVKRYPWKPYDVRWCYPQPSPHFA